MASLKLSHFFFVIVLSIFLLSHPAHGDVYMHCTSDEEDHLLQGLNSFRKSVNLPAFTKNKNAQCVAKKIVDICDSDQPCTNPSSDSGGNGTRVSDYPKAISKCNIDPNTTTDAMVLPVCVPELIPTLVLTNFTLTRYSKFINDSTFDGIGLSSEEDLMVVVLASSTPAGSLANGAYSLVNAKVGLGHYLVLFLLGSFL